ncbi:Uncharacterized protein conserved in cyanobacteria [Gloeomargarita lithophora Alchichica-D10]|uniref:Uncharacterized protein conserved in cyanobacteria n=1 Tax=Gloeomargarita lithophora Alchichica-D10 TaxID=1188229 RepID=A0A1J0AGT8_9CYAN|nr:Uma2 family endonuclease [Gloeomargarita lithophora]APB35141.1 Uncharacterized protein conserved in cyanobacteria [Gloeomargarita lithophora Alchichica-D10]
MMQQLQSQTHPTPGVILHDISWQEYERLLEILSDKNPGLHLNYLAGVLEIMPRSSEHEQIKKMIARLLEIYALERGIALYSCGSTTLRNQSNQRGLEPDESYCIGTRKLIPDVAVEVIVTSGGLNRLEIYRGLGVMELWQWQNQQLTIQFLNTSQMTYELTNESRFFSGLSASIVSNYLNPNQEPQMLSAFRRFLQQSQGHD